MVVDVKCPLVAFEQAYDEQDEEKRAALLLQHASALKTYANDLGKKSYWQRFERSPDFVIMFIPGEHFLAAAAERAPKLIEEAFRKGVIIASTINMLALAKIMAGMWRQEALAAQAKEIAALGKELHARIQTMGGHVVSLGRNLRLATDSYDDFIGSLDAKVLTQAKRFEDLKVAEGNKRIVDPQRVDFTPKVSSKLPANQTDPDEPPQIAAE
jgi:DNA recombination protein RmuC